MRTRPLLVAGAALSLLGAIGCGGHRYEWHEIYPINSLEARSVSKGGSEAKEENEGTKKSDKQTTEAINGVWLYRLVRNNFPVRGEAGPHLAGIPEDFPRLRAIEVMFCPSKETNFNACRVGVVWREDRHPFGTITRTKDAD